MYQVLIENFAVIVAADDGCAALKSIGLSYNEIMRCKIKNDAGVWVDSMVVLINHENLNQ